MPGYERDENNSGGVSGAIIGLVPAGIGALAAAMTLQIESKKIESCLFVRSPASTQKIVRFGSKDGLLTPLRIVS